MDHIKCCHCRLPSNAARPPMHVVDTSDWSLPLLLLQAIKDVQEQIKRMEGRVGAASGAAAGPAQEDTSLHNREKYDELLQKVRGDSGAKEPTGFGVPTPGDLLMQPVQSAWCLERRWPWEGLPPIMPPANAAAATQPSHQPKPWRRGLRRRNRHIDAYYCFH